MIVRRLRGEVELEVLEINVVLKGVFIYTLA